MQILPEEEDEVLEGEDFLPFDQIGHVEYGLPTNSVYSVAIIGFCCMKPEEFKDTFEMIVGVWITFTQIYLMLLVNYLAQSLFLWHIIRLVDTMPDEDKCGADTFLCFTCACLFLSSVMEDIMQTKNLFIWHRIIKTEKSHKALTIRKVNGKIVLASGLTKKEKIMNTILILIPKLLIGLLLAYYGAAFIAISPDNETIILNTLAVVFIIDIDEMLFKSFADKLIQEAVDGIPSFRSKRGELSAVCNMMCGSVFLMGIIGAAGAWSNSHFCPALENIEVIMPVNETKF